MNNVRLGSIRLIRHFFSHFYQSYFFHLFVSTSALECRTLTCLWIVRNSDIKFILREKLVTLGTLLVFPEKFYSKHLHITRSFVYILFSDGSAFVWVQRTSFNFTFLPIYSLNGNSMMKFFASLYLFKFYVCECISDESWHDQCPFHFNKVTIKTLNDFKLVKIFISNKKNTKNYVILFDLHRAHWSW